MTNRVNGLPDEILTAIVAQIQTNVSALSAGGACFIALHPEKTPGATLGNYFCVVAPSSGKFRKGFFEGGGQDQCTVEAGFVTRIYSTAQIDPATRDGLFLTDASRGIFQVATQVLKALAGFDPQVDGAFVVRDQIEPKAYSIGRNERSLGWIELEFELVFDWDLT